MFFSWKHEMCQCLLFVIIDLCVCINWFECSCHLTVVTLFQLPSHPVFHTLIQVMLCHNVLPCPYCHIFWYFKFILIVPTIIIMSCFDFYVFICGTGMEVVSVAYIWSSLSCRPSQSTVFFICIYIFYWFDRLSDIMCVGYFLKGICWHFILIVLNYILSVWKFPSHWYLWVRCIWCDCGIVCHL